MKYTILAKFLIPIDQTEVVLRDSLYSGVHYAGCYLLSNVSDDREDWYREHSDRPAGYMNRSCRYAVAYEDWGNVFLKEDATEVSEDQLDQRDYFDNYTSALLGFQAAINELVMEMNTTWVKSFVESCLCREQEREQEAKRKQAAKEEFEQRLAEDPPLTVK